MATYYVTKIRKERSADGSHEHIAGVCTITDEFYSRSQVVASINGGNTWWTYVNGALGALIRVITYCPAGSCRMTPYITTRADDLLDDNLESLPRC